MTKYREVVTTEVEAVHWTGNSIELAKLVGAPVSVDPDGTAKWPTDDDEVFGVLPPEHVGVMFPDGRFEAIPVAAFSTRFKKVLGPRPRASKAATPAAATPETAPAGGK